jgi:hypothetical protein
VLSELIQDPDGPVHVLLDEGGLRCSWRSDAAYVPFAALTDANLTQGSLSGRTLLSLTGVLGEELHVRLENGNPLSVVGAIFAELSARRASPRRPLALPAELARDGRPLDAWISCLLPQVAERGYREVHLDRARLGAIFADDRAEVEARSAAAFLLVAAAEPEELRPLVRAFVLRALPPLVLVAARLTPGGAALVDDPVLEEQRRLLPHDDRASLERARAASTRDPGREALLAQALRAATAEALAEAQRGGELESPLPGGGLKRLHSRGAAAANAWVGRAWAL